jgi:Protein of unknown function (DUF1822)
MNLKSQQYLNLTIDLDPIDRSTAQKFASLQPTPEKAIEVYRNVLATYAAVRYLKIVNIDVNLEQSEGGNLGVMTLKNTASLYLPEYGNLDCILIDADTTQIDLPDFADKSIGILVLRTNQASADPTKIEEVEVLGFIDNLSHSPISVSEVKTTDDFYTYLEFIKMVEPVCSFSDKPVDRLKAKFEEIYNMSDGVDFEYNILQFLKGKQDREKSVIREQQEPSDGDRQRLAAKLAKDLQNLWGQLPDCR